MTSVHIAKWNSLLFRTYFKHRSFRWLVERNLSRLSNFAIRRLFTPVFVRFLKTIVVELRNLLFDFQIRWQITKFLKNSGGFTEIFRPIRDDGNDWKTEWFLCCPSETPTLDVPVKPSRTIYEAAPRLALSLVYVRPCTVISIGAFVRLCCNFIFVDERLAAKKKPCILIVYRHTGPRVSLFLRSASYDFAWMRFGALELARRKIAG